MKNALRVEKTDARGKLFCLRWPTWQGRVFIARSAVSQRTITGVLLDKILVQRAHNILILCRFVHQNRDARKLVTRCR
jgi:hypothetical protein